MILVVLSLAIAFGLAIRPAIEHDKAQAKEAHEWLI